MRVFLDVGAHNGETLLEAIRPRWGFDRIVCFEPASSCWPVIESIADGSIAAGRVELCKFGLWTADTSLPLHDPGDIGGSIVAGKARTSATEVCEFVDAATWFRANVEAGATVHMKVNCEGAECDLLDHLLDAGELARVDHLLVQFDVEKIAGLEHRAAETRQRLDDAGIAWREGVTILFGRTHQRRTANWLAWTGAGPASRVRYTTVARLRQPIIRMLWRVKRRFMR